MSVIGHVHIANDRLWAWCDQCEAEIKYQNGRVLDRFKEELARFRDEHKDCKKEKVDK